MKNIIAMLFIVVINSTSYSQQPKEIKTTFKVYGECGMCKNTIEKALKINGVSAAIWNPDTKMLKIKYQPSVIPLDSIHRIISKTGYDTELYKAPDEAYEALHKCCKYERRK